MSRILVLYCSTCGHVETMVNAGAEGARTESGTEVTIKRVAELMPAEALERSGAKLDQDAPVIEDPNELADYDAVLFGTPTRFGNMCIPDAELPRPDGRAVGEGRADRQGRVGVHRAVPGAGRRRRSPRSTPRCCTTGS